MVRGVLPGKGRQIATSRRVLAQTRPADEWSIVTGNRRVDQLSTDDRSIRSLRLPAVAYGATMVLHGADHAVRGFTADHRHTGWPGGVQVAAAVLTLAISALLLRLVLTAYRHSDVAAIVIGFGSAALFLVVHLLPQWITFIDSFATTDSGAQVTAFSWITAVAGISAALWLGIAGLRVQRR